MVAKSPVDRWFLHPIIYRVSMSFNHPFGGGFSQSSKRMDGMSSATLQESPRARRLDPQCFEVTGGRNSCGQPNNEPTVW
jgi:hypothetical protein